MEKREGTIVAVCRSIKPGLPKYAKDYVLINPYGISSDYHCNPLRIDFKNPTGPKIPNTDRHILVFAEEALQEVNAELGLNLEAGDLGENILVCGFGNLSDITPGAIIKIREGNVVFRVSKQNKPCINTAPIHPLFNATIYSEKRKLYRRGLLCSVEKGDGWIIRPNDPIEIYTS